MKRIIRIYFFLTVIGLVELTAQQDPHYTQYMFNTMSVNPAYAGSRGHAVITALGRAQWVGFNGAPDTQNLSFDTPLGYSGLGLGINLLNDKIGPSDEFYFDANGSYSIETGHQGNLSFGLRLGGRILNIDWSKGQVDENEPIFANNISGRFLPTVGAGVYYHEPKWYVGLSVPNFLKSEHYDGNLQSLQTTAVERMHFYFIGGYVFDLTESIKLKPATLLKAVAGAPVSLDISATVMFNEKFRTGIAWRWDDSISVLLGFQVSDSFLIGYAYDLTTTNYNVTNSGTHEVMIRYDIFKELKYRSPRFFLIKLVMRIKLHLKKLLILCMCISINSYAQSKRVADRYFEEFSYVRSAELYKDIYNEKGDDSKHVLSRLADSYYNNADVKEAEVWYSKLVEKYKGELSDAYLFKYAQVLRSTGKYKKSDSILKSLKSLPESIVKSGMESSEYILEHSKMKEERISVSNLAINSEYSDYGGFILDGNAYFTSSALNTNMKQKIYDWNNQPFLNIYKAKTKVQPLDWSKKDTVLVLDEAKMISAPVTTEYHEGKPIFTKDGKTMYFTRNNFDGKRVRKDKKKIVNLKVFKASLINGVWTNVVELPFNSDDYSVGHPVLSSDEKALYFTSDMPGGFGMTDLYMVEIYAEDNYGVPKNLGDRINTRGREEFPFVGKDGTLYFSSDGHTGLGLLDIFQTKLGDNVEDEKVINLENH